MLAILASLGVGVSFTGNEVCLCTRQVDQYHVPDDLMREMRSGIFLLGPLLGRLGKVRVCYPGGCAIGPRPINLHLKGLRALGAEVEERNGYIELTGWLKGARIGLNYPSVGATENLMLAAVMAKGETVLYNAAREPEIVDLQNFLNTIGARISGAGSSTIFIKGVKELTGGSYRVFPDRIVSGTLLIAAAITGGQLVLEDVVSGHLEAVISLLQQCGAQIYTGENMIYIRGGEISAVPLVCTSPYPGFPTDLQAPYTVLMALARGGSLIIEKVFKERFGHIPELQKMGARVTLKNGHVVISGVPYLTGAQVEATDLRAGAALVLAGLAARGQTVIKGARYIDRGYDNLPLALTRLGADIERVGALPVN
ncbi:MAG TPA: UDP-N-acetylglucosamine 1-carboxyvinyltransferase, partial [Firmicutes bacterium]|nr:UDP-N-acetylglucosamine 1-carboxyvinyltransferase [Bacillota bacterium]